MNDAIAATIRGMFDEGSAAWNRGDIDEYLASYWDSEETRWARGTMVIRGKGDIEEAFKARFPTVEQMGSIHANELEIEVLSEKDALVFGQLVHTVGDVSQKAVFTVHMKNIGGDWVAVSDHVSTDG